jgi:hypothetical protein
MRLSIEMKRVGGRGGHIVDGGDPFALLVKGAGEIDRLTAGIHEIAEMVEREASLPVIYNALLQLAEEGTDGGDPQDGSGGGHDPSAD